MPIDSTCLIVSAVWLGLATVVAFNLSPRPNIVLREPDNLTTFQAKIHSSYFGFSLVLRKNSIIVGAPRAQSNIVLQRSINETGMVFKCRLSDGNCEPFVLETHANFYDEGATENGVNGGEMRDHQWLGASMDSAGSTDQDSLIVCAPRLKAEFSKTYYMHGICYWTPDTNGTHPKPVRVKPLIAMKDQFVEVMGKRSVRFHSTKYIFGEQGISVHMTDGGRGVLIGAPGISDWSGSVIRVSTDRRRLSAINGSLVSVVPNPVMWSQQKFSYFGYAVTSGRFFGARRMETFAASAPRAKLTFGEVHLFGIGEPGLMAEPNISVYRTLRGLQMGEYFGYALVAGDFNNDSFADLAVAAPMHAEPESYENGVVYVYINRGRGQLDLQAVLRSRATAAGGRFGSAIADIGDLNGDGFNDLLVGAPFEGDGAVYIFHGGPHGVASKWSQRLEAPARTNHLLRSPGSAMFGLGLSKGCDIDSNRFPDIAIGAANDDTVYVFKSYPVVRLMAQIVPEYNEIDIGAKSLSFRACWRVKSRIRQKRVTISITIDLDELHGRLSFESGDQIRLTETASDAEQCSYFNCSLEYVPSLVFRPIAVVMHYRVLNGIPDTNEFCEKCVAVDPSHPSQVQSNIVYGTGCDSDRCMADLQVSLFSQANQPYVLGTSRSLTVECSVNNLGETGFLTQLIINLSDNACFLAVPSNCRSLRTEQTDSQNTQELLCDVVTGGILPNGANAALAFLIDATSMTLPGLTIDALVFSAGDERNETDNAIQLKLDVVEISCLEMIGKSSEPQVNFDEEILTTVHHQIQIRNTGPSAIRDFDLFVLVPITLNGHYLIDVQSVEITHNRNTIHSNDTKQLREHSPVPTTKHPDLGTTVSKPFMGNLPPNRTVFVNCSTISTNVDCIEVRFQLNDLLVNQDPIVVTIDFTINMKTADDIWGSAQPNVIVIQSDAHVQRRSIHPNSSHVHLLSAVHPYTIVRLVSPTPVWVFVVSTIGGLVFLATISYVLHRRGFFNRETLEDFRRRIGVRPNMNSMDMDSILD